MDFSVYLLKISNLHKNKIENFDRKTFEMGKFCENYFCPIKIKTKNRIRILIRYCFFNH